MSFKNNILKNHIQNIKLYLKVLAFVFPCPYFIQGGVGFLSIGKTFNLICVLNLKLLVTTMGGLKYA